MKRQLNSGIGSFSSYINTNPYNQNYPNNKYFPGNRCQYVSYYNNSSSFWLLAPAGVGSLVALGIALSPQNRSETELCLNEKRSNENEGGVGILFYSAFSSLALAVFVYCSLKQNMGHLFSGFIPLTVGILTLILYFGSAYFLLFRLNPENFSGNIGHDFLNQFVSFLYYSITTFATAQDGDIKPSTMIAKLLTSMEVLFFIFIFTLGIVLFAS